MTVLYLDDWNLPKYADAIVDDKTTNVTWVQMAAKYKSMGVKNYYFHLCLIQPELQGVDPFNPLLDDGTKLKILWECTNNYWYFMREIIKVPAKTGTEVFPLSANRGNIAMFWCMFQAITTYVQQIRQTGKSLNIRALVALFHNFAARNSTHILFTKSDLRKKEIEEYKAMRKLLPDWMYLITKKDRDNQHEFTTSSRNNITRTYVPAGDPVSANNVGRGQSPALVTPDEVPFLDYADVSIASLISSTMAVFDIAKKNGDFHGICYTTTCGDLSTRSGAFVYNKIKKKGMFFSEMLYDCVDRADTIATIKLNGGGSPFVDISFNHRQLGFTDGWLVEKINEVPSTRAQIQRDYLGIWTYGSGTTNPIKEVILNRIRDTVNENPLTIVDPTLKFLIRYHAPIEYVKSRKMVMGLDTSNAVGRDAITGVGIDVETGETLMAFGVNEVDLNRFAWWLVDKLVEFPNMTLVPENKSSWQGMLSSMIPRMEEKRIDWGRRIYSTVVQSQDDSDRHKTIYRAFASGAATSYKYYPFRNNFGYPTDGALRKELYIATLTKATKECASLIRDPILIDEISSLVKRDDRIDHKASGHDDYVVSWLLAQWFLRSGWNLGHYGINERKILTRARMAEGGDDPREVKRGMRQEKLLAEIAALQDRADNAKSPMEERYLMNKIKALKQGLDTSGMETDIASLGKIVADAKDKKQEVSAAQKRTPIFGGNHNWFGR